MDKNLPLGQNAAREFFLWAIFMDRFELAKYLCSKTWVRLCLIEFFIMSLSPIRINLLLH
jgi:hypothetical protein